MDRGGQDEGGRRRARQVLARHGVLAACAAALALALLTLAAGWTSAAQRRSEALAPFGGSGERLLPTGLGGGEAHLGRSVALSADGSTALVGAPYDDGHAGTALVFVHAGSGWTQQAQLALPLTEGARFFGRGVALSADGSTAVVGAPGAGGDVGAVSVFARSGTTWTLKATLAGAGEVGAGQFGRSVSVSADGGVILVGGYADAGDVGAVWTFVRSGGTWVQQGGKLTGTGEEGSGWFGRGVAISADGSEALVGASNDAGGTGAAWAYARRGEGWELQGSKLTGAGEAGAGQFGESVALSSDGSAAVVGGPEDAGSTGAVWVLARSGGSWSEVGGKLTGAGEAGPGMLGYSVSLSGDGGTAIAGGFTDAEKVGAAWVFQREGGGWEQIGPKLTGAGEIGHGRFGLGVALSGDGLTALVGAYTDDEGVGAAWAFRRPGPPAPAPEEPTATTTGEAPAKPAPAAQGSGGTLGSTAVSAPVLAVTGNVEPVSGHIRVRLPGTSQFVLLPGLRQIPFGTLVDATAGRVLVTAARPGTGTQSGEFFSGQFLLGQSHNGVVTTTLAGGSSSRCSKRGKGGRSHKGNNGHGASAHASARRHGRRLWANAHGTFSSKGNYASGAVQGTEWLTEDRCSGTFIRVTRDKVLVTDLVRHRTHLVHAGHGILIKP